MHCPVRDGSNRQHTCIATTGHKRNSAICLLLVSCHPAAAFTGALSRGGTPCNNKGHNGGIQSTAQAVARSSRCLRMQMSTLERPQELIGKSSLKLPEDYSEQLIRDCFRSCQQEQAYYIKANGVPADLEGVYFRNGPGCFEAGDDLVDHPFDGDGMLVAFYFKDGKVFFRNRFIRTEGYIKEQEAGKILYRGAFTNKPGGVLKNAFDVSLKNVANTSVRWWGGKLLALWEASVPHEMDPATLHTVGISTVGGVLKDKEPFSAHPRVDPKKDRFVNFSSQFSGKETKFTIREFSDAFNVIKTRVESIPNFLYVHDFLVSENFYAVLEPAMTLSPLPSLLGLQPMGRSLKFNDKKRSMIHLIPRDLRLPRKSFDVHPNFSFHLTNAYDDPATGEVVYEANEAVRATFSQIKAGEGCVIPDDHNYERDVPNTKLVEYRVHYDKGTVKAKDVSQRQMEFATVNPAVSCQQHRYIWAVAAKHPSRALPLQAVIRLDRRDDSEDIWMGESDELFAEPVFASRKGATADSPEDHGYILILSHSNAIRGVQLLIFDAANIQQGPITRLPISTYFPQGLHGQFVPGMTFSDEQLNQ